MSQQERNLFDEVEEVEQLVRSNSAALDGVVARLDNIESQLTEILSIIKSPPSAASLKLTLGQPIPQ